MGARRCAHALRAKGKVWKSGGMPRLRISANRLRALRKEEWSAWALMRVLKLKVEGFGI